MEKLIENEILNNAAINAIQLNSDDIALPTGKGLCYEGVGIQFEHNGKRYDATAENTDVLMAAVKQSAVVKWYWNKNRFLKYGGTTQASFNVSLLDRDGKKIPDIVLKNMTKSIQ